MNRFEELQARISDQGRSMFDYTVDWIEWSARKNLAIAEDVADFTVSQLRLPIEADGLADYGHVLRNSYGSFGDTLKGHGEDYVSKLKDVPAEVRAILVPKKVAKKVAKKAAPRPKASKPRVAAAKKATAKTGKAA